MNNDQFQTELNKLARMCNKLVAEAKKQFGEDAHLFYEAEGSFHIMSGDSNGSASNRQDFVEVSSTVNCHLGAGAW